MERRRWKRHSFNAPIRLLTDSAVVDARCIRMSEGGIYLFAAAHLELGTEIKVDFTTDAPEKLSPRSGIIRNRAIYLYGVEFLAGDHRKSGPTADSN